MAALADGGASLSMSGREELMVLKQTDCQGLCLSTSPVLISLRRSGIKSEVRSGVLVSVPRAAVSLTFPGCRPPSASRCFLIDWTLI